MSAGAPRRLIMAMGNDLLRDDAIALQAIRPLAASCQEAGIDLEESSVCGLYVVDAMEGYDQILLVDSLSGRSGAPGTIHEIGVEELPDLPPGPSPHYVGLPQALHIARSAGMDLPDRIDVLAIEVADPYTFDLELSPGMDEHRRRLTERIRTWVRAHWGVELDVAHTP